MVGKERRALARVAGRPDVLVLREGMKLGRDNAELKAILPGGIILVEKLVNVYGEEEYLETVIPISQ
jgi:type IV pilus assembly protein PilP